MDRWTIIGRFKEEARCYADGANLNLINMLYLCLFNAGFQLDLLYRLSHKLHNRFGHKRLLWLLPRIITYLEKLIIGSHIDPHAKIGRRAHFVYGMGIVIGSNVEIGDDLVIFNGVSLGSAMPGMDVISQPRIGNGVFIGTGAKLLGGITIGDNVKIGANAVVLDSFGPDVTVVGVPARMVKKPEI